MPPKPQVIPPDIVVTLVESVGRREDAEFYLRLFRELPKHSFAIVAPDASALEDAQGRVASDLRFLAHLGLFAPVVLGLFRPAEAEAQADALSRELGAARLKSRRYAAHVPRLIERLERDLDESRIPIVVFNEKVPLLFSRFTQLGDWARQLGVLKLVLLRGRGGVGPHAQGSIELGHDHQLLTTERGISLINLRRDHDALLASGALDEDDRDLLAGVREAMQSDEARADTAKADAAKADAAKADAAKADPGKAEPHGPSNAERLVTSVTAPTNLLHELFTVKGAGTLVKHGSLIEFHRDYSSIDRPRLEALLTATFGRNLKRTFFDREPIGVYVEQGYLGAAVVSAGERATYLTKFVVDRLAQGLGIGRDLWEAVTRDHERLFWRARPQNPITQWYQSQCDGMVRTRDWNVYWRGVEHEHIPGLIREAVSLLPDFES
jgi:N-acetyltransferase of N-acetylglutamate synthase